MSYSGGISLYRFLGTCLIILLTHSSCDTNKKVEINKTAKSIQNSLNGRKILLKVGNIITGDSNIPFFKAHILTLDYSHVVSAMLIGDSIQKFNDWYFYDLMNDIKYNKNHFIPNSTVSIKITVHGHFAGQMIDSIYSFPISSLEIVRFKLDSNRVALLDYLLEGVELFPDDETVNELIRNRHVDEPNNKKNVTKNRLVFVGAGYSSIFFNIGMEYYNKKNYSLASKYILDAVKLKPNPVDCEFLGVIFAEMSEFDNAIKTFELAKEFYLKTAEKIIPASLYHSIGATYTDKGELIKAEENLKKAIEIRPNEFSLHRDLGRLYLSMRRPKLTIEHYTKAVKLNPEFIHGNKILGKIYCLLGNTKLMIENLEKVAKHCSIEHMISLEDTTNLMEISEIFYCYKKTIEHLDRVIEKDSMNTDALYNLGLIYESLDYMNLSLRDKKKAAYYFQKAAQIGHEESKMKLNKKKRKRINKSFREYGIFPSLQ